MSKDTRFNAIINEIVRNPAQDFSVPRLAAITNMSERHFSRLFTDKIGLSPGRFVEELRVEHACDLIQQSDLPIKSIYATAGFSNAEHMRRAFRRVKGVSPSDYQIKFGCRSPRS